MTASCPHRGPFLKTADCNLCGFDKGRPFEILQCSLHGECSLTRKHSKVRSCATCPDNPDEPLPPATTIGKLADLPPEKQAHIRRKISILNIIKSGGKIITPRPSAFRFEPSTVPEFLTLADLMRDTHKLASMLPADTSRIIAISRSGIAPGAMISELLHLPLSILNQSEKTIVDVGHGWRFNGKTHGDGPVVVVDDNQTTGRSMRDNMKVVRETYPAALSAVVYRNRNASLSTPDLFAREVQWPFLSSWNLFNGIPADSAAFDMDGVLCADCSAADDDDGPRYLEFLRDAEPLYPVRRSPIALIVTARLEKYRAETLAWLERHGMTVKELIMWPGTNHIERNRSDLGAWKGEHFKAFMAKSHRMKPALFIESDVRQAQRIAEVSGGIAVCPAAGRCFSGAGAKTTLQDAPGSTREGADDPSIVR